MTPLPRVPALAGAAVLAAAAGALLPAALLATAVGGALLLAGPVLGSYLLVAMAQLDGIVLLVDRHLPVSTFKLTSAALLAALLVTARVNPLMDRRPRLAAPMLATLLFALWLVVTHALSPHMGAGRDHTVGFLSTLLMVAFIALSVRRVSELRILALILVGSGAISAALMIAEAQMGLRLLPAADPRDLAAWQGEPRPSGASAYNPTTASHLLLASLVAALVLAIEDARWRWIWAGAGLVCLAALPMTGARSALLGLGLAVAMIGWTYRRHRRFPLVCALSVAACLLALPFAGETIWERFAAVGGLLDGGNTADRTLLRRMSYNQIGLELWAQNPITGVGPGAFPSLYAGAEFRWFPGRELEPRQLHNSYLEVAVETGLIGLGLFCVAVFGAAGGALRAAARATGEGSGLARAFGIALAAFLLASLFMPNEDNKYLWILVALCCKAASLTGPRKGPGR